MYPSKLINVPDDVVNQTYDPWNASPKQCQLSYAVKAPWACDISELRLHKLRITPETTIQPFLLAYYILQFITYIF